MYVVGTITAGNCSFSSCILPCEKEYSTTCPIDFSVGTTWDCESAANVHIERISVITYVIIATLLAVEAGQL